MRSFDNRFQTGLQKASRLRSVAASFAIVAIPILLWGPPARAQLGSGILTERPDLIAKRVRHGLASNGLLETSCLWMGGVEMYRGMAPEDYRRHLRAVLDWHSWLSDEDYRVSFASFFATPRDIFPATAAGQDRLGVFPELLGGLEDFFEDPVVVLRKLLRNVRAHGCEKARHRRFDCALQGGRIQRG